MPLLTFTSSVNDVRYGVITVALMKTNRRVCSTTIYSPFGYPLPLIIEPYSFEDANNTSNRLSFFPLETPTKPSSTFCNAQTLPTTSSPKASSPI